MGIKNYKTNLIETFPNIKSRKKPENIHTLCLDVNTILHNVCHIAKNENEFKKILLNSIKDLVKKINPSCLAIFTDGQAILAKANTQIKRRNKYLYTDSSGVSPLNLTPGTPFMESIVDNTIKEYLNKLSIKTYYSSSRENNEGEIKLFEWLIRNNIKKKVCIAGNDSDLIVIALASRPLIDIYIYNNNTYISLKKLVINLADLVPTKFNYNWHPIRMDFVLISLFQGNDYNDRLADFKKLLNAYIELQKKKEGFLIKKNGSLNLKAIKKLLQKVKSTDNIECDKTNIYEYIKCIQWNINLYTGNTTSNFIPKYNHVNISSLIKYIPEYIPPIKSSLKWLNKDVYLLLLMPSVGKNFLPKRLQHLLNEESPIKDLFPDPCPMCIEYKDQLKKLIKPPDDSAEEILEKYKEKLNEINKKYLTHLNEKHQLKDLPIKRLQTVVSNL